MRGEQIPLPVRARRGGGSPPLARGTGLRAIYLRFPVRITPACAGNSGILYRECKRGKDHPRLRGEQMIRSLSLASDMGSPPLARGTVMRRCIFAASSGITPACAGNSGTMPKTKSWIWDHPRLRGEQLVIDDFSNPCPGSPPLARGTGHGRITLWATGGITPACAGNRTRYNCQRACKRDHPRLRGEQIIMAT